MNISFSVLDPASSAPIDVVVSAPPEARVQDLEPLLREVAGVDGAAAEPILYLRGKPVSPATPLAGSGLRDGAIVGVGRRPAEETAVRPGTVRLRVVGGPDAGAVFWLIPGTDLVMGRSGQADIVISDTQVSRQHLRLHVAGDGVGVEDLGSTNGTVLGDTRITGSAAWPRGTLLRAGESLLSWDMGASAEALVVPMPDGALAYNRPPRLIPPVRKATIEMPSPPSEGEKRGFPMLAIALPLLLGVVMFVVTRQAMYLLFTLMSPALAIGNYVSERRRGSRSNKRRREEYETALGRAQNDLATALLREQQARREACPDATEVLTIATGPSPRLWERRRGDTDTLVLRLGIADLPAETEVRGPRTGETPIPDPVCSSVPVTVPLRQVGVLGVAGGREQTQAVGRWLVAQAAALHSPRDLGVVVLTDAAAEEAWGWARWLPHLQPRDGQDAVVLLGNDVETVTRRLAELVALVTARTRALEGAPRGSTGVFHDVIVVLDGARTLRAMPGATQVLREGPAVGIHAICLDESELVLPEECRAVATFDPQSASRLSLRRHQGGTVTDVLADQVPASWADRVARALAPLRDVSREEEASGLPSSARLLDVLELEPPTPDAVLARWTLGGRTTAAVIGVATEGPFAVDIRADGPHALVAGTTGAGKSELLQTVIASLAVANRPDALNFVLVDYKGGSAFKDCARLPHTVGLVTDLDGHQTERALVSLTAELKRRETILGVAGAKDIDDYWDALVRGTAGAGAGPLPRLLIVIDEFASLVEELPDFVRGLVGIAQRGRSLGVHLVLATQRPSGVVSPEIRANTNLRIALRVTDTNESSDVIDAPDAGRIPRSAPGRGYARTGHASLNAFQTARIGGRRPGAAQASAPLGVQCLSWRQLGYRLPAVATPTAARDEGEATDLSVLVEAIDGAAARLGAPAPFSPWLPSLPEQLVASDLPEQQPHPGAQIAPLPYALEDLPADQQRRTVALDVERGGHLLVVGSPRSGRSTMLRTLAGAVAARTSSRDLHLHALDCGNGALLPLTALPHCGAVVTRDQVERADRLIGKLLAEASRRQQELARRGFADLAEQRAAAAPDERMPYILLLVDRWEGFTSAFEDIDGGRLIADFLRLLREAPSVGIRAVVTGDRTALTGRLSAGIEDRLCLRLNDRADYGLAGLNPRTLPDSVPPGRAFRGESGIELQIALLAADPSGPAQVQALQALAAAATSQDAALPRSARPDRIAQMPSRITLAEVRELSVARPASPLWAMVGVGGDDLEPTGVDLETDGPGFLIAGPVRSGRSTALMGMARSLLEGGCGVVVITPRRSPLRELAGAPGVLGVLEGEGVTEAQLTDLVDDWNGRLAICIDDADLINQGAVAPAIGTILREARDRGHAVVAAGTTDELSGYRGLAVEVRKSRTGLLLTPGAATDGDLLGSRLPQSALFSGPVGRGILMLRGSGTLVQVPTMD